MKKSLAVIQFPGSNCEYETARAASHYGFDTEIVRWNIDRASFEAFDAYILPGGFSYQDRVRAGAIAAKLPVMDYLEEASDSGKPILGICNGCQILAESGLIPNSDGSFGVSLSLSYNRNGDKDFGFVCDWVYVTVQNPENSLFTRHFKAGDVLPIAINHGEGNFRVDASARPLLESLTSFQYCDDKGVVSSSYPVNPNGTENNIAGLCNKKGNVLGVMPHPERASFVKQIPGWIEGPWAEKKRAGMSSGEVVDGPWSKLFLSMKESIS